MFADNFVKLQNIYFTEHLWTAASTGSVASSCLHEML